MTPSQNAQPKMDRVKNARKYLGSACSHPEAIDIIINGPIATVQGAALESEVDRIEAAIRKIPGVQKIRNQLSLLYVTRGQIIHKPSNESTLRPLTEIAPKLAEKLPNWMRILLGASGLAFIWYGLKKKDLGGLFISGFGLGAIARAITNLDTVQLFELVLHPQISLEREIDVNAPIERVYHFWSHFENYARFMSYVKNVQVNDQQGFTWTMVGPAGVPIRWDSKVREMLPNQAISWESLPNSWINHSGHVLFKSRNQGRATRLRISLNYAPPGGALGREAIRILGFDPRSKIDGDLLMMKALVEKNTG